GGSGIDTLIGGEGYDDFRLGTSPGSADLILDFTLLDDKLVVDAFGGISSMDSSRFRLATESATADHRFIYDAATGVLSIDEDGSGTSHSPIEIVKLVGAPALTYSDIVIYINPA